MSLDDLANENPVPRATYGQIARLRRGTQESRNRTGVGNEEIGAAYEARLNLFPLRYKKGESGRVVFLNSGKDILAHKAIINWKALQGIKPFPVKENIVCRAYVLNKEGAYEPTGEFCPWCAFLGRDPRLVVIFFVADLRKKDYKGNPKKVTVSRIELDHNEVIQTIFQGVEIEAAKTKHEPNVKYALFQVTRTTSETSLGCGDAWNMISWVDADKCAPYMESLPDVAKGWPHFSNETTQLLMEKHKKVCDEKLKGEGYSEEGYTRALEEMNKTSGKTSAAKTTKPKVSGTLEDFADVTDDDAPAPEKTRKTTTKSKAKTKVAEKLEDIDSGTAPDADADADEDSVPGDNLDDFDPWSEE